jgi:hypothetical protein
MIIQALDLRINCGSMDNMSVMLVYINGSLSQFVFKFLWRPETPAFS